MKDEFNKDHEQFKDEEYRARRNIIADYAHKFEFGQKIQRFEYNEKENKTWEKVFHKLVPLYRQHFSKQFLRSFDKLLASGAIRPDKIPQLCDLDEYLKAETGFRLMPVHGIVDQREFLNTLGLRVFCCTQYIRHHNHPEYTPEPDICHEIFGHVPMFADQEFADLSHELGLLTLGAESSDITRMGALYWWTIEFGSIKEDGIVKPYGAGIASSFQEIENHVSGGGKFEHLQPFKGFPIEYPIQTVQNTYMYTNSLGDMKRDIIEFGKSLKRPFKCYYDFNENKVKVNKRVNKVEIKEESLFN